MNRSFEPYNYICTRRNIIGALLAPIIFISNNAWSSPNAHKIDDHLCFLTKQNTIQVCKNDLLGFNTSSLTNTFSSQNAVRKEENTSSIYNYIQQPENPTDFGSYIISILALIASIGVPLWQRYIQKNDSKTQKIESINEGFWIREVVMPQINANTFRVCSSFRNNFNLNETDFTRVYKDELLPLLNELRDSFSLLNAFPKGNDSILALQEYCDDFEDHINDHINEPIHVRKGDVAFFQLTVTKELMKTHKVIS